MSPASSWKGANTWCEIPQMKTVEVLPACRVWAKDDRDDTPELRAKDHGTVEQTVSPGQGLWWREEDRTMPSISTTELKLHPAPSRIVLQHKGICKPSKPYPRHNGQKNLASMKNLASSCEPPKKIRNTTQSSQSQCAAHFDDSAIATETMGSTYMTAKLSCTIFHKIFSWATNS
ncbi:hypothetical protein C8R44DRAFT_727646 [Mycena epipterygia]|nr:hypothetical protein C8R44DRAFT_727646 [Mycena epipterygia]